MATQKNPTGSRGSTQGHPGDVNTETADTLNGGTLNTTEQAVSPADAIMQDKDTSTSDATDAAMAEQDAKEETQNVPGETKAEKFVRLAKPRVNRALTAIASFAKLSSSAYESTPEQRAKAFATMRKAIDTAEAAFQPKKSAGKDSFDF